MSRDAVDLIARTIRPARGRAWHGGVTPTGALRGVSAAEATWIPAPGRHSIWSLALHIAYWKYAVRRRLERGKIGGFPRSPANWPALPRSPDERSWKADRALVAHEDERLGAALRVFDPAKLHRRAPGGKRWSYGELIIGALAHDAYHTGQIQLLKRLWRAQ
jgi:DinB superfamily